MIKKTILIENSNSLSIRNGQIIIVSKSSGEIASINPDDIGIIIFDNKEIVYSHTVMQKLIENNIAIIFCNDKHLPIGMYLNFDANYSQTVSINNQIELSQAKKDRIWKFLIKQKITNQAILLEINNFDNFKLLKNHSTQVKNGDSTNREAVSAKAYWKCLFGNQFKREREGSYPNNLLNYGYAILRGITAKSLSGSGLLPMIGIHHHNQYNSFCLADDIMEPYRPFIDKMVYEFVNNFSEINEINTGFKKYILKIAVEDVQMNELIRPLAIALTYTTSSLAKYINGDVEELNLPRIINER